MTLTYLLMLATNENIMRAVAQFNREHGFMHKVEVQEEVNAFDEYTDAVRKWSEAVNKYLTS